MHGARQWVGTHWVLTSLLTGIIFALVVYITHTGVAGAAVAATIWAAASGLVWNQNRLQTARAQRLLDNAREVRDCLLRLSNEFGILVAELETAAPLNWSDDQRADFSRRLVRFAVEQHLIPRLRDAVNVLGTPGRYAPPAAGMAALDELIRCGDSALGVIEERPVDGSVEDGGSWVSLSDYLTTWHDLNTVLYLLSTKSNDVGEQQQKREQLHALVARLKEHAPNVALAQQAGNAYTALRISLDPVL